MLKNKIKKILNKKFFFKTKKKTRAFSLMELIVVLAIIGVLSAITTFSVSKVRARGYVARVKTQMSELGPLSIQYLNTNQSFTNVCLNMQSKANILTDTYAQSAKITALPTSNCYSDNNEWVVFSSISDTTYWCVDYTGNTKEISIQPTSFNLFMNCSGLAIGPYSATASYTQASIVLNHDPGSPATYAVNIVYPSWLPSDANTNYVLYLTSQATYGTITNQNIGVDVGGNAATYSSIWNNNNGATPFVTPITDSWQIYFSHNTNIGLDKYVTITAIINP